MSTGVRYPLLRELASLTACASGRTPTPFRIPSARPCPPSRSVLLACRRSGRDGASRPTRPAGRRDAGLRISMDGRGRWIDNVFIERLHLSISPYQPHRRASSAHSTAHPRPTPARRAAPRAHFSVLPYAPRLGVHRRPTGEFRRYLHQRLADQHRHRVEVRPIGAQPQPLRLRRDRCGF